jgi:transcription-repair coupling factor (superfamily II helicase)
LDIPNANTIIVNNANHFGLSDLHQLRGRVGRSNKKAFCYLISPPLHGLPPDSRRRLKTIEEFAYLGSGFNIAMKDLDIRGAGNLLGGEQSGFISDIGFHTFQKILTEAIQELRENEYKDVFKDKIIEDRAFVTDCQIDTDLEMHIPDYYVNKIDERLTLYRQLNELKNEAEIENFANELRDRFGHMPKQVKELFNALRLSWIATRLGFERVVIKGNKLRCIFLTNQNSPYYQSEIFTAILSEIQEVGRGQIKQRRK